MTEKLLGTLEKGLFFIVSAPAGTGKTTLVRKLTGEFPCVVASISCTTRQPRAGEVDGVDYHFLSKESFLKKVEDGEFLEYVELYGEYYGTSQAKVAELQGQGKHVLLVIDTQGAQLLKGKIEVISIFIAPPSYEELEKRLTQRHTESKEKLEQRLLWAREEMKRAGWYDYCVVNDELEVAYQVLRSILIAEEHRVR